MRPIPTFLIALVAFLKPLPAAEFHVSPSGDDGNSGSSSAMLRTISEAAERAQPGDTITVHQGVYRERVNPPRGGTSENARITYQAAPGENAVIKGSEVVTGWELVGNDTWKVTLPNSYFGDFNPYNNLISGDWFGANGRYHHTGAVYLNGHWLTEAANKNAALAAAGTSPLWFAEVESAGNLVNMGWLQPYAGATAGTRVDASYFDRDFGVTIAPNSEGSECVGWIDDGDWTRYDAVDFGTNADNLKIRAASVTSGGIVEARLDGPAGALLGSVTVPNTGGWQTWQTFTIPITPTSGVQHVCLVYRALNHATATTTIYAQFPGKNPNNEQVEINVRQSVFYPDEPGLDFITVRGLTIEQAATQWAPPTAEQIGAIGTNWGYGWIIENNTVRYSVCSGIALGKYGDRWDNTATALAADGAGPYVQTIQRALANGWHKGEVGSHRVRGNHISHCEQTGIVGSLGCAFSIVENNHIHDIHIRKLFSGAEQSAIKFHGAIDVEIARNHIHHSGYWGTWLDWMAQGTRVTGNVYHDNDEDLFLEVNHGPFVVDHNLFLSGNSLYLNSQGGAFSHNLIAGGIRKIGNDTRLTPHHQAHSTAMVGLYSNPDGDMRFHNNILTGAASLSLYNGSTHPVAMNGNVFLKGAVASSSETSPLVLSSFDPTLQLLPGFGGYYLKMNADPAWGPARTRPLVTTALLGNAVIPNLPYEQADGTPYQMSTDYLAAPRNNASPFPGPFETVAAGVNVWKVFDDPSVSTPSGLTAATGIGKVVLSWNTFQGATSYKVKRATTSGGPYTVVAGNLTGTSWTDTGVTIGVPYYYVISATDGVTESSNSAQAGATPQAAIRINAGGQASGGFSADAFYSTGFTWTNPNAIDTSGVANAAPAAVYQSERWGNLTYTVPGLNPGASYQVRLHFAEIYFNSPGGASGGTGSRVFNVLVNGSVVLPNFDVFAVAGGANKAVVRETTAVADANGRVTISLAAVVSNAKISGFEILPLAPPPGYNAWTASFSALADSTPEGDPDHDGVCNLIEYVIGGDPRVAGAQLLPSQSIVGPNLVLSFKRNDDSEVDTIPAGQWSTNLQTWTNIAPVLINENGSNPDDMSIAIPLDNAVAGKLFGRLQVTKP